ncbi:hypothetical protein OG927_17630 [Streptomyces clavifer]|nr:MULTISPECIES: hypothetical protein [unclassified Streptomyces]KQX84103.1 hypothetical protein ASD26_02450 [Streptomyces sp. Root1319]KQZ04719.1 hypothetical protein ASD51_17760 [Streptomyces sp. Root55]WUC32145.1 hypothetical protein OG927_17630 [Streptomyces clavifer]
MQTAAEQADGMLDAVLKEVKPAVSWTHGPTTAGSCEVSRRRTIMTVISESRRGSFLGVVDRYWRSSGYRITAMNNDADFPALYAKTEEGYMASLRFGGDGQAFFRIDSPCVEESEVAESTTKPTAPTYEGMEHIPRPNIRSPFWSAGAP